jgi:(2Fe-2S) ferredoxin
MFEELSLHILDIAMNSITAQASVVQIMIAEHARRDKLSIRIQDNGRGMDADTLKRVLADLTTAKRSRKKDIGLGLALLRQTAEMCGGEFHVRSTPGVGTTVTVSMKLSHVDRPPVGDLNTTVLALCAANPAVEVQLHYLSDTEHFHFSSKEPAKKKSQAAPNEPGAARRKQIMNLEELKKLKEKAQRQVALREGSKKYRVVVSMGTSGIAAGAREVMKTMLDEIEKRGLEDVEVRVTGEVGLEDVEPVIRVEEAGGEQTTYARLDAEKAKRIVAEHLEKGKKVDNLAVGKEKKPE